MKNAREGLNHQYNRMRLQKYQLRVDENYVFWFELHRLKPKEEKDMKMLFLTNQLIERKNK